MRITGICQDNCELLADYAQGSSNHEGRIPIASRLKSWQEKRMGLHGVKKKEGEDKRQ